MQSKANQNKANRNKAKRGEAKRSEAKRSNAMQIETKQCNTNRNTSERRKIFCLWGVSAVASAVGSRVDRSAACETCEGPCAYVQRREENLCWGVRAQTQWELAREPCCVQRCGEFCARMVWPLLSELTTLTCFAVHNISGRVR